MKSSLFEVKVGLFKKDFVGVDCICAFAGTEGSTGVATVTKGGGALKETIVILSKASFFSRSHVALMQIY